MGQSGMPTDSRVLRALFHPSKEEKKKITDSEMLLIIHDPHQRLYESHGSKHNTLLITEPSAKGPQFHCLAGKQTINKCSFRRKQLNNELFFFSKICRSKLRRGKKELTHLIQLHQDENFTPTYPRSCPGALAESCPHTSLHRGGMERFVTVNANARANPDSLH